MPHVLRKKEIGTRRVFCEFRYGIPAQYESIKNVLRWLKNPKYGNGYGTSWRCWSGKVSAETMKNTPWEERET